MVFFLNMDKVMVYFKLGRNVRIVMVGSGRLYGRSENARVDILCKFRKIYWRVIFIERIKRIYYLLLYLLEI